MALSRTCTVDGCGDPVRSNGLCCAHYYRVLRHGSPNQTRPKDWGKREKHPLYSTWINLRGYPEKVSAEWLNDFWQFASDVIERPSKNVFLKRPDESRLFGKDNFVWSEKKIKHDGTISGYAKAKIERFRQIKATKLYRISPESRAELFEKQNHLCAICKKPETRKTRKDGPLSLAVDHCHTTNKIRGLLCANCNQAIGLFKEDISALRAAIDYLSR